MFYPLPFFQISSGRTRKKTLFHPLQTAVTQGYQPREPNVTILQLNSCTSASAPEPSNQGRSLDLQNHQPDYYESLLTTKMHTTLIRSVLFIGWDQAPCFPIFATTRKQSSPS